MSRWRVRAGCLHQMITDFRMRWEVCIGSWMTTKKQPGISPGLLLHQKASLLVGLLSTPKAVRHSQAATITPLSTSL